MSFADRVRRAAAEREAAAQRAVENHGQRAQQQREERLGRAEAIIRNAAILARELTDLRIEVDHEFTWVHSARRSSIFGAKHARISEHLVSGWKLGLDAAFHEASAIRLDIHISGMLLSISGQIFGVDVFMLPSPGLPRRPVGVLGVPISHAVRCYMSGLGESVRPDIKQFASDQPPPVPASYPGNVGVALTMRGDYSVQYDLIENGLARLAACHYVSPDIFG